MATNLIALVLNEFRGDTLDTVAAAVGETPSKTQAALGAVLPALMAGLVHRASTAEGANGLLDLIRRDNLDSSQFADAASAMRATDSSNSLINTGRSLLESIFGSRSSSVTDWVSSAAGIGRSTSSSLLSLALPILLGRIGRQVLGNGWSAANLMSLLGSQQTYLKDAPAGLASIFGGGTTARVGTHDTSIPSKSRELETYETVRRRRSPLWSYLPLLLLIPLLGYFFFMRREEPRMTVVTVKEEPRPAVQAPIQPTVPGAVGTTGVLPNKAVPGPPMVERRLPGTLILRIPTSGVESRLIGFIQDPTQLPNKETWFTLDRIEFAPDSARLMPMSSEQLRDVAAILMAYPNVKIKIGGYTDNVGDDAYNMKLSTERATATMNRIVALGVNPSRLTAEGYGESHPVADNSTAEGRQRNRRIDIRVTEK